MRKVYTLICGLILLAALPALAQKNLQKGYEALKVFNYFEAHKIFKEELRKDKIALRSDTMQSAKGHKNPQEPAAAAYGLGLIFLKTDNPFSNVDSAYAYTNLAAFYFAQANAEQRGKLIEKGIPVDSTAIITQYTQIYQRGFGDAKAINTIPAYESFINRFPFAGQVAEAKSLIEGIDWENTQKSNTADDYRRFVFTYPSSARLKEAKAQYELLLFKEQTREGTIDAFNIFIFNYPNSPYRGHAEDSVYAKSTTPATVNAYASFIRQNTHNRNINKAWDELYTLYTADGSEASMQRFKKEFPDYPRMDKLNVDIQLAGIALLPIAQAEKWGYIDTTGKVIIAPQYDYAGSFVDGLAVVEINGKTGYVNKAGALVIEPAFEEGSSFDGDYAIAKKDGKYGVIGRVGNTVLPFEYDDISALNELRTQQDKPIVVATYTKGPAQGFVDLTGTVKFNELYEEVNDFYQGLAVVKKDSRYGYVNAEGKMVIANQFDWADNFRDNGLARVKKGGMLGMITRTGKEIVTCKYATLNDFTYGYALMSFDGKYGFINTRGEEVILPQYPFALPFEYNLMLGDTIAKVEYKGKRGYINTRDKSALPIKYEDSTIPSEGLVGVKEKGKWGYVDKDMKTKIAFKLEGAGPFKNGMAVAKLKGKKGLIGRDGKWVVEPQYDEILDNYASDCYFVVLGDEYGLIDNKGKELLPVMFEEPEFVRGKIYRLISGEKAGYYSLLTKQFIWKE